ncbi:FMN-linked oxidoreductase [Panus rudis PR-1116 ss-1]|nr:FMN-linked oxidoreductase [Panus rudis PR-1116 ss-1]
MPSSKLFQPITIGEGLHLKHRVVLAPMTRFRATREQVIIDLAAEYYAQRASTPGTLLISEVILIAARAGGMDNIPAIETSEQMAAWKKVTDAVHGKGSYIIAQLWAIGRTAHPDVLERDGFPLVGSSDIALYGHAKPRPLTKKEIKDYVELWAKAAQNAIEAGFDGVELHGSSGSLIDQFLQDVSNNRTDEYGGSVENRARFVLEIIEAVVKAIGAKKVGLRLSPWSLYRDMRMKDPIPQFSFLVSKIAELYPDFGFLHLIEPTTSGFHDRVPEPGESNDFLRDIWRPRPFIATGGFTRDSAIEHADKTGDLVGFGKLFISNPDLPRRLKANYPLTAYDRDTFYKVLSPDGYTDYPFADDLDVDM